MFLDLTLTWQDIVVHILIAGLVGLLVAYLFLRFILGNYIPVGTDSIFEQYGMLFTK